VASVEHDGEPPERVRIVCVDASGAILLIKWRDPLDGHVFWEPPGGGIEDAETPRQAAVRELFEETGLRPELSFDYQLVERDYTFAGRHHHHIEAFFHTRTAASPRPAALTEEELQTYLDVKFWSRDELAQLDAPLQPPELVQVLDRMSP